MQDTDLQSLRDHLIAGLRGGQAFDTLDEIAGEFPPELRGIVPDGAERSAWQIVDHIRIALRDILDFSANADGHYVELDWPDAYWPKSASPPTERAWDEAIAAIHADLATFEQLIADPASDLFTPFPWGSGQTLLREALLVMEHNAHHLGQLVVLRRLVASSVSLGGEPRSRTGT